MLTRRRTLRLAASALGCDVLEVHIVFSRESFGPDTSSSVTLGELQQLVEGIRFVEKARSNPVDKDAAAASMGDLRRMFGKSLVAARDLAAGSRLGEPDIALKKPGTGSTFTSWMLLACRIALAASAPVSPDRERICE